MRNRAINKSQLSIRQDLPLIAAASKTQTTVSNQGCKSTLTPQRKRNGEITPSRNIKRMMGESRSSFQAKVVDKIKPPDFSVMDYVSLYAIKKEKKQKFHNRYQSNPRPQNEIFKPDIQETIENIIYAQKKDKFRFQPKNRYDSTIFKKSEKHLDITPVNDDQITPRISFQFKKEEGMSPEYLSPTFREDENTLETHNTYTHLRNNYNVQIKSTKNRSQNNSAEKQLPPVSKSSAFHIDEFGHSFMESGAKEIKDEEVSLFNIINGALQNPNLQYHRGVELAKQIQEIASLPTVHKSQDETFRIFQNHLPNIKSRMGNVTISHLASPSPEFTESKNDSNQQLNVHSLERYTLDDQQSTKDLPLGDTNQSLPELPEVRKKINIPDIICVSLKDRTNSNSEIAYSPIKLQKFSGKSTFAVNSREPSITQKLHQKKPKLEISRTHMSNFVGITEDTRKVFGDSFTVNMNLLQMKTNSITETLRQDASNRISIKMSQDKNIYGAVTSPTFKNDSKILEERINKLQEILRKQKKQKKVRNTSCQMKIEDKIKMDQDSYCLQNTIMRQKIQQQSRTNNLSYNHKLTDYLDQDLGEQIVRKSSISTQSDFNIRVKQIKREYELKKKKRRSCNNTPMLPYVEPLDDQGLQKLIKAQKQLRKMQLDREFPDQTEEQIARYVEKLENAINNDIWDQDLDAESASNDGTNMLNSGNYFFNPEFRQTSKDSTPISSVSKIQNNMMNIIIH